MTQRLRYAYQAPEEIQRFPLLGSFVRALGKTQWSIALRGTPKQLEIFHAVLNSLKDPKRVVQRNPHLTLSFDSQLDAHESHFMTVDTKPNFDRYDLISDFQVEHMQPKGVIAITGNGKGKTTTALGIAAEQFAEHKKVAVIQWFKEKKSGDLTWAINEHQFSEQLKNPDQYVFFPTGAGFVGSPNMDRVAEEKEHTQKAKAGLALARRLIQSGEYATIVLDEFLDTLPEVMTSLPYPLLSLTSIIELLCLAVSSNTQIIVTGRRVIEPMYPYIATSIVVKEIKHPWSSRGAGAVSGLDF